MSRRRGVLADEIVDYVRERILAGDMKPGEKVDQDAIGEALDVSRSPIREALVVLGKEGLVEVTPRRGAFVAHISREDVVDHYELFGLVAGRVAEIAASKLSDAEVAELRSIHDRFESATPDAHAQLNDEFHRLINSAAPRRTRWLLKHLERSIPARFFEDIPAWGEQAGRGHAEIVSAIADSDGHAARDAMEEHLHAAGLAAAAALEERGFWKGET
ncbi:MAG: GntR family transcriptional regulator [Acidimicrobiales bacterium]